MRRTLTLSGLAASVLLTAAVPLVGSAAAAACPTWTDSANDTGASFGTFQGVPLAAPVPDPSVDITNVLVESSASGLVATFTVPKLSTANETTYGDRFAVRLDVGGTIATMFTDRDDLDTNEQTGVQVGNSSFAGGSAKYDVAGKKVVLTMPTATFDAALKKPFAGLTYTIIRGDVISQVGAEGASATTHTMDTAPAPANTKLVGGVACGSGGGGPVTPPPAPPAPPAPTAPPAGAMPTDLPKAGCFTVTDGKGDAKLGAAENPNNDPDLDILGATFRATPDWFLTYIKVDKLGTNPAFADGHRFGVDFTFNKHTFVLAASSYRNAQSGTLRDTLAATGVAGKTVQLSVDAVTNVLAGPAYVQGQVTPPFVASGAKAVFDVKNSMVTLGVPIADVEKYGKAPFAGALLDALNAESQSDYYRNSLIVDTTTAANSGTGTAKWVAGDNKCFTVGTKLGLTVAKAGAKRTVTAKLTTVSGQAIPAKAVTFYLNGVKGATLKTAANGTAVLKNVKPGTTVKVVFVAGGGYLGATATKKA